MRSAALGAVLGLHALALGALLAYEPARSALLAAAPIMVELITPPKVEPRPTPLRERPRRSKPDVKASPAPPEPQPVLTAPAEAPSPVVVPPSPVPPAPPEPAPVFAARPQAAPAPAVTITAPVFNADYLENPAPAYPAISRRIGEQGRVVLRVLVSTAGSTQEVQVRTSSGHARLDEAARETVRRWTFVPAKRGEQPVAAWVLIPISFSLEG